MWIARDEDDRVFIYTGKPKKGTSDWMGESIVCYDFLSTVDQKKLEDVVKHLSWDDTEPIEIDIKNCFSSEKLHENAVEYEKSINDPDCPFYTPEDIIKAYEEGYKKI